MARHTYYPFITGAPIRAGSAGMSNQFVMGNSTSVLAKVDESSGTDPPPGALEEIGTVQFVIQTGRTDLGNQLYKFIPRTEIVGDVLPGISLDVQYSDNDHQSFSSVRSMDMGLVRPRLSQNGRSRRRIFRVGNMNCARVIVGARLEALELFVYGGHAG